MGRSFDYVVIGGGVMGASILFQLATRGAGSVLLLEQGTLGFGSTGRSSGVIRMHYSTEVNTRLSWESLDTWRNWSDVVGHGDAGWTHTGFMIFSNEEYRPSFETSIQMQQRCGVNVSLIGRGEALEIAPAFSIGEDETVAYEPESGYGDPSGSAIGWVTAARALGATAELERKVTGLNLAGDHVTSVEIDGGETISCGSVILATGPWSGRFLSNHGIDLPLKATRHEVFLLRRNLKKIPFHPGGADMANLTYFRPEAADLTLVGNGNVVHDADPDNYHSGASMDYLYDVWSRLAARIPQIEDAEYTHGYAGLYTETPDSHPIMDAVEQIGGLYICTGFSGHGYKLSPAVGVAMAELILDGRSTTIDITSLRMGRFDANDLNQPQTTFRVMV
jgi:sarcosine oxidase, subunit beta